LLFATEAAALCKDRKMRLLVAGRGNARLYKTRRLRFWREKPVQFLGEVRICCVFTPPRTFLF